MMPTLPLTASTNAERPLLVTKLEESALRFGESTEICDIVEGASVCTATGWLKRVILDM